MRAWKDDQFVLTPGGNIAKVVCHLGHGSYKVDLATKPWLDGPVFSGRSLKKTTVTQEEFQALQEKAWNTPEEKPARIFQRGEIVSLDGKIGTVTRTGADLGKDLHDHTGIYFGTFDDGKPEIWTVPTAQLLPGPDPVMKH